MATITILGAMKTSPADTLDLHAFLPPTPILLQEILHRSMTRMAMLPKSHPLHPHIKWIEKHNIRRHKSALHHLIHSLDIRPSELETINPHPTKPNTLPPMLTCILPTKEKAIEEYGKLTSKTKVFTDGSCIDGKVGAAAVLYVDDRQISTLHFHLGSAEEHTVFEAEVVGLILAAHLLNTSHEATFPAVILADNQAAIQAGEHPAARSGHYLCLHFRTTLRTLLAANKITRQDITVQWIAGHRDVEGNEDADREARRAALKANDTSPKTDLPKCLHKKLPIGASAVKQKNKAELMALWKRQWSKSKRYAHLMRIDPSAPCKRFMKAIGNLPKFKAGTMYQMRSGHIALNKHLHRINRSDTPLCLQCNSGMQETVHHMLFECPRYDRERHVLRNKLGRAAISTPCLLANRDGMRETWKFIEATGRLKPTSSEGPTT